jgi:hypothetical protein
METKTEPSAEQQEPKAKGCLLKNPALNAGPMRETFTCLGSTGKISRVVTGGHHPTCA